MIVAVIIAFIIGVGLVLGGAQFADKLPDMMMRRKLDERLQEISSSEKPEAEPAKALLKTFKKGPLPAIDKAFGETARGRAGYGRLVAWTPPMPDIVRRSPKRGASTATRAA